MRPFTPEGAVQVTQVTACMPDVQGAPVHGGDIPVFRTCGVTPREVLPRAGLPPAITHAPGHMFVTDLPEAHLPRLHESVR